MSEDRLPAIFFALSDGVRRQVLEEVGNHPGATVTDICNRFRLSRFAIMRHLNILEEAGLITREAVGRERRVRLTAERFEDDINDWLSRIREGNA
jgi:DNA-binding transcriptional ArsR family regulator